MIGHESKLSRLVVMKLDKDVVRQALRGNSSSGFSLLEMLVVLVIAGVLLKMALPSFTSQSVRLAQVDARNSLLEAAAWQEKYYTRYQTYSLYANPLAVTPESQIFTANGKYVINITACENADIGYCFVAQAVPVGDQLGDSCGTFFLDSNGRRYVSNTSASNCW